ncbi:hypothetical protein P0Y31_09515 [Knoellia sp. 3-2P3]|uniref:hypothetical protein n=1 Tax=unclassified Knoellia TaxID=2618719 RepID=UPI0023DC1F7B|nr:hypothetical protein [Knoellia sp. 3-2P3]MDF2092582.1 hypothetical protein [Knoellia sp. 3-2P3]
MNDLPEYCGELHLVFGFHGILLVDAESHIDAQAQYTGFHSCDVTMVEHCMLAPRPERWGIRWQEPPVPVHACGYDIDPHGDDLCEVCDVPLPYMESREIDPKDERLADIDLEADKASVAARIDQMLAHWRDRYGSGAGD